MLHGNYLNSLSIKMPMIIQTQYKFMNEDYEQNQSNWLVQCLTQYLQYFKIVLSAQLGLIQSFLIEGKSITNNPTFMMSKVQNKQYSLSFQYSPFKIQFSEKDRNSIQRFYLRIAQFLQYRLSPLKNLHDQQIQKALYQFQKKLNKIFKYVSSPSINQKNKSSLGQLFQNIEERNVFLINNLLNIIIKTKKNNFLMNQLVTESLKLIQTKFNHLFQSSVSNIKSHQAISRSNIKQRQFQNSERKYNEDSKINLIDRNASNSSFKYQENPYGSNQSNNIHSDFQNHSLFNYVKKQQYHKILDIMEVEPNSICSKQFMLKQLIQKNKKNSQLIDKFLKKYSKKFNKKRRLRQITKKEKQQSSQQYKLLQYSRHELKSQQSQTIQSQKNYPLPKQNGGTHLQNKLLNRKILQKDLQDRRNQDHFKHLRNNHNQIDQKNKESLTYQLKQIQKGGYQDIKNKLLKSNKDSQQIIFKKHVSMKGKNALKIQMQKLQQSKISLIQPALKSKNYVNGLNQDLNSYRIKHSISNSIIIADKRFPQLQYNQKKYQSETIKEKIIIRQKSTPNKNQKQSVYANQYNKKIINQNNLTSLREQNLFVHLPHIPQPKRKILSQK